MGREKEAAVSTKDAKAAAKAKAEAPPPPPDAPKRRLNRIPTAYCVAKPANVLSFGASGPGEWICSSCGAVCFASRPSCFKCKEPRETSAAGAGGSKDKGGGKGGGASSGGKGGGAAASSGGKGGGAAASSGAAAPGDEAGIVLKEWHRLPKQLLQLYCDRAKLPRPRYTSSQGAGGLCKAAVWLNNPKDATGKSDKRFQAPELAGTTQDAQHRAALYALFGVEPAVQHQLKLPEPYRTIWLDLHKVPPTSGSKAAGGSSIAAKSASAATAAAYSGGAAGGGRGCGAGGGRGSGRGSSCGSLTLSEAGRDAAHRALIEARSGSGSPSQEIGPLQSFIEKSSSPRCSTTKPQKLARKELEKSKKLETAVPRPLSSTYDYVITTQLKI